MSPEKKIKRFSESKKLAEDLSHQQLVLCYGHFNIIHPGHIRYLEHARSLGQLLVVVIQDDAMLNQSNNTHHFSAQDRAFGLAWLHIVDFVLILDCGELEDAIRILKPKSLVLGKEYQKERQRQLKGVLNTLEKEGGTIVFDAGEVHYASKELLDEEQSDLQKKRRTQFQQACSRHQLNLEQLQEALISFKKSRLLVLGETIVDQYVACDAMGMSAEAPVLVVQELKAREYLGGAAIVAAHVRSLGAQCHYLSVVGQDANTNLVRQQLDRNDVSYSLISDPSRPTTFKIRYMVENQKLFRVSRLKDHTLSEEVESQVIERLRELASQVDGILVSDFVYGVITDRILEVLQELSKLHGLKLFGDQQCSTQVGNIDRFQNFHLLCPTEKEARIALRNRDDGIEQIANSLRMKTNSKNLLVKMGADGFIAYGTEDNEHIKRQHFPALCPNPVDVTGAGDSLLACIAVGLCSRNSLMVSAAIGACMASLAVQTVGNLPVCHERLQQLIIQYFPSNSKSN